MPAFQRRTVQAPLHLDHPYWVYDHDVDLDAHVHTATLPAPGDLETLGQFVGDVGSRLLPRDRPLWELWLVDGLSSGQVALVSKMHHCTIYGSAGADLMAHLLDFGPEGREIEPAAERQRDPGPSALELLARAGYNGVRRPTKVVRGALGGLRRVTDLGGMAVRGVTSRAPMTLPFSAPKTILNGRLTERRLTAFTTAPLEDLKTIKKAFDCKINDVVLAAVTMSLRDHLLTHGELPGKPLVASVPVIGGCGRRRGHRQGHGDHGAAAGADRRPGDDCSRRSRSSAARARR